MHTAAIQRMQTTLQTYGHWSGDPTYAQYLAVDAFMTGLKAAGPNPTQAAFINAMLGITQYNAAGLRLMDRTRTAVDAT